jgi:plastocyanin
MYRRQFVEKLGAGWAALLSVPAVLTAAATRADAAQRHEHGPIDGPLAQATVAFGQWNGNATPVPFDRFGADPNNRNQNHHVLAPFEATIKAGGAVSFIISGFHNVVVYDDGTQPQQIDATKIIPGSVPPGLIDYPTGRIFRGVDPRTVPQDRIENVTFPNPGRYLVLCAVVPHFVNDNMYGYVRVLAGGQGGGGK